jgi:hypothetical protein
MRAQLFCLSLLGTLSAIAAHAQGTVPVFEPVSVPFVPKNYHLSNVALPLSRRRIANDSSRRVADDRIDRRHYKANLVPRGSCNQPRSGILSEVDRRSVVTN